MTMIYKPVLIETAEQAEALPEGAFATHPDSLPLELSHDEEVGVTGYGIGTDLLFAEDLVGWTALVPIEAEEERDYWPDFSQSPPDQIVVTRLVTPWRED